MTGSRVPDRDELAYVLRASRWQFIPLGAAVGAAAAVWIHVRSGAMPLAVGLGLTGIALGAAFLLDDPAATTLESVPVTVRRRTTLRVIVAAAMAAAALGYLAAVVWTPLRYGDVAVELAGLLALALAVGATGARIVGSLAGIAGAGAATAVLVADQLVLTRWVLVTGGAGGASPGWWLAVCAIAAAAYLHATRDPAARGRRLNAG